MNSIIEEMKTNNYVSYLVRIVEAVPVPNDELMLTTYSTVYEKDCYFYSYDKAYAQYNKFKSEVKNNFTNNKYIGFTRILARRESRPGYHRINKMVAAYTLNDTQGNDYEKIYYKNQCEVENE